MSDGRRAVVVLVAVLVLASVAAAPASAEAVEPSFEVYVASPTLTPGTTNELSVQVVNDAGDPEDTVRTAQSVRVELRGDGTPVEPRSGERRVAPLADGEPQQLAFAVDVPYEAPAGTYELSLRLRYVYRDPDSNDLETATTTLPVRVRIDERPLFALTETTADVAVGDSGNVSVTVRNVGSETARDATVRLQSTSSEVRFGEAAAASRFAGSLEPGEARTLEFGVTVAPGAERGRYALQATVNYLDADGAPGQSRTLSTGLVPAPEREYEFAIGDVESDLAVGREGTLSGTVTNVGNTPVDDAVLVIRPRGSSVTPTETEVPLGRLAPGEGATFNYTLDVSDGAGAGPRQFDFVVEYRDADDEVRTSDTLSARTSVAPSRDTFAVEGVSATVTAGQGDTLRVRVTNQRDEALEDVSAKLFVDDPLSTDDDEAFLGTIEPGESATATFSVSASAGALAKSYPVEVDFQYTEPDGDTKLSDTYTVPVTVERADGGGLPLALLGGAVLLVLLAAGGGVAVLVRR